MKNYKNNNQYNNNNNFKFFLQFHNLKIHLNNNPLITNRKNMAMKRRIRNKKRKNIRKV